MKRPALKLKPEIRFGAEPKKLAALGGLLVVALIVYFINASDSPSNPAGSSTPARALPAPLAARPSSRTTQRIGARGGAQSRGVSLQEFRPTLKPKDPIDPSRVDPTLKLRLLAKLSKVPLEGVGRSLFDFSTAPPPKVEIAKVKPILPGQQTASIIGPVQPKPPGPAAEPPATPIPLKFYGFTNTARQGRKRAFFLDGEDILFGSEGELIKNRYKVVRIGVNSVVVEDTTNKKEQTLPLEAEQVST
jgi:hypothetical protein